MAQAVSVYPSLPEGQDAPERKKTGAFAPVAEVRSG